MRVLMLTMTLAAVALAGCSDDPITGDFQSEGSSLTIDGHVHSGAFVSFNDPTSQVGGPADQECLADGAPPQADPAVGNYRCTQASTEFNYMFLQLPDIGGFGWTMAFADSTGTNPMGTASALTDNGDGTWAWNYTSDVNEKDMFDSVVLMMDGTVAATSGIEGSSALAIVDDLQGITFTGDYENKELTLTVEGIGEINGFTYTAWLVTVDDAGVKTHGESFSVTDGENTFTATQNIDKYQEVHIHVTGTQMNVAVGAL